MSVFSNTDKSTLLVEGQDHVAEGMIHAKNLSYRLEIHEDGTIGVQCKLKGKPIGGMPVLTLASSSVSAGLLRAAD